MTFFPLVPSSHKGCRFGNITLSGATPTLPPTLTIQLKTSQHYYLLYRYKILSWLCKDHLVWNIQTKSKLLIYFTCEICPQTSRHKGEIFTKIWCRVFILHNSNKIMATLTNSNGGIFSYKYAFYIIHDSDLGLLPSINYFKFCCKYYSSVSEYNVIYRSWYLPHENALAEEKETHISKNIYLAKSVFNLYEKL